MKEYKTKEECLNENGEHAWFELPKSNISCAVYHYDGHCDWNDPKYKCYHCPATKTYTRISPPVFAWLDDEGKEIKSKKDSSVTETNLTGNYTFNGTTGSITLTP